MPGLPRRHRQRDCRSHRAGRAATPSIVATSRTSGSRSIACPRGLIGRAGVVAVGVDQQIGKHLRAHDARQSRVSTARARHRRQHRATRNPDEQRHSRRCPANAYATRRAGTSILPPLIRSRGLSTRLDPCAVRNRNKCAHYQRGRPCTRSVDTVRGTATRKGTTNLQGC